MALLQTVFVLRVLLGRITASLSAAEPVKVCGSHVRKAFLVALSISGGIGALLPSTVIELKVETLSVCVINMEDAFTLSIIVGAVTSLGSSEKHADDYE